MTRSCLPSSGNRYVPATSSNAAKPFALWKWSNRKTVALTKPL